MRASHRSPPLAWHAYIRSMGRSSPLAVSIHSLPAELLLQLFVHVIEGRTNLNEPRLADLTLSNSTALLRLSHICKTWRKITLDNGSLWASVIELDHKKPSWMQELIRRAKAAPLTIYAVRRQTMEIQDFTSPFWFEVFAHFNNWACFEIMLAFGADNEPLKAALAQPASNLKDFCLHHEDSGHGQEYSSEFILPHNLFAGHAPRLHRFSVHNVCFPPSFDFSVWRNLTVLQVTVYSRIAGSTALQFSAGKWLNILAGMVQLQHLDLSWITNGDIDMAKDHISAPDVYLNRLEKLELWASRYDEKTILERVFSKLFLPLRCQISIDVTNTNSQEPTEVSFDKLMIGINRMVKRCYKINASLTLSLWQEDPNQFNIDICWQPGMHTTSILTDMLSIFTFSYEYKTEWSSSLEDPPTPFSTLLTAMKSMLPCFEGISLDIRTLRNQDRDALHAFLLGLENVTYAEINLGQGILDVLVSGLGFNNATGSYPKGERLATIVLPGLTSLICYFVHKDSRLVDAYMSWRSRHGKFPKAFLKQVIKEPPSFD